MVFAVLSVREEQNDEIIRIIILSFFIKNIVNAFTNLIINL